MQFLHEKDKIKVAIMGCGAVTELGYLPALVGPSHSLSSSSPMMLNDLVDVTYLVDINLVRAEQLARHYDIQNVSNDISKITHDIDGVIVALPHYLHKEVCIELMNKGIHILVEKPMALTVHECNLMIEAANKNNVVMAVALLRRFSYGNNFIKFLIDRGALGRIKSFDSREGFVYGWPVASDFFFKKEMAGGGVLIDTGAHILDTLLWWFGDYNMLKYTDDDMGGVEANCELTLGFNSGIQGFVELSRTRNLRNTHIIFGEFADLEISIHTNNFKIKPHSIRFSPSEEGVKCEYFGNNDESYLGLIRTQILDWISAIRKKENPKVNGDEACKSIALINDCYNRRTGLKLPWLEN